MSINYSPSKVIFSHSSIPFNLERLFKFGSFFSLAILYCLDWIILKRPPFFLFLFTFFLLNYCSQCRCSVGWAIFKRRHVFLCPQRFAVLPQFLLSNTYQQRALFIGFSPLSTCYSVTTKLSKSLILAWRGARWERMCISWQVNTISFLWSGCLLRP